MHSRQRPTVLLLPGLYNSGPEHWQTHWERERADCHRVVQADWERPRRANWVETLERAVAQAQGPVVLAAHSLACALVAHWAEGAGPQSLGRVQGALLVAPSDVEAPSYPSGTEGFVPMPLRRLPFRTTVVVSSDDPYVSPERASQFARAWGAGVADVGAKHHLGSAARLGAWAEGQRLLEALLVAHSPREA